MSWIRRRRSSRPSPGAVLLAMLIATSVAIMVVLARMGKLLLALRTVAKTLGGAVKSLAGATQAAGEQAAGATQAAGEQVGGGLRDVGDRAAPFAKDDG